MNIETETETIQFASYVLRLHQPAQKEGGLAWNTLHRRELEQIYWDVGIWRSMAF